MPPPVVNQGGSVGGINWSRTGYGAPPMSGGRRGGGFGLPVNNQAIPDQTSPMSASAPPSAAPAFSKGGPVRRMARNYANGGFVDPRQRRSTAIDEGPENMGDWFRAQMGNVSRSPIGQLAGKYLDPDTYRTPTPAPQGSLEADAGINDIAALGKTDEVTKAAHWLPNERRGPPADDGSGSLLQQTDDGREQFNGMDYANNSTPEDDSRLQGFMEQVNDLFNRTYEQFGVARGGNLDEQGVPQAMPDEPEAEDNSQEEAAEFADGGPVEDPNGNPAEETFSGKIRRGFKEADESLGKGADQLGEHIKRVLPKTKNYAEGGYVDDEELPEETGAVPEDGDVTGSVTEDLSARSKQAPDDSEDTVLDVAGRGLKRAGSWLADKAIPEEGYDYMGGVPPAYQTQPAARPGQVPKPADPNAGTFKMLAGVDAMDPQEYEKYADFYGQQLDPQGLMSDTDRKDLVLSEIYKKNPDDAKRVLQLYRGRFLGYQMDALAAFQGTQEKPADYGRAVDDLNSMFPHLPGAPAVKFVAGANGVSAMVMTKDGIENLQLTYPQAYNLAKLSQFDNAYHKGLPAIIAEAMKGQGDSGGLNKNFQQSDQGPPQASADEAAQQQAAQAAQKADADVNADTKQRLRQVGEDAKVRREQAEFYHAEGQKLFPFDEAKAQDYAAARMRQAQLQEGVESREGIKAEGGVNRAQVTGQSRERVAATRAQTEDKKIAAAMERLTTAEAGKMSRLVEQHLGRMEEGQQKREGAAVVAALKNPANIDGEGVNQMLKSIGIDPTKLYSVATGKAPTDQVPKAAGEVQQREAVQPGTEGTSRQPLPPKPGFEVVRNKRTGEYKYRPVQQEAAPDDVAE